ncbi:uncharacterized protein Amun [Dermacentor andersoni]|uniref:uncharacterized protein Amun n=1 Tax=Dermacentor andersoni TaxID=34620 RepID=UPI00215555E4|nr:uncharacterized protein LOC126529287 [Dermacentor andersoni]
MAEPSDTTLTFFTKATPSQWSYVLSLYKEVLKQKAALRTKKGGPEELIKLDAWYQEQLPKTIQARKDKHLVHEELVKIMKWKLMRGKYRPQLLDLVRINTELAVKSTSKKAFRKLPNLSGAITALTNLKGIGPATASAILAAAFPEQAPYMADESMLSTPGVEATDYTLAEYLNYAERIKTCTEQLAEKDPNSTWTPHKVELVLWAHYVARELKPSLLDDLSKYKEPLPSANGNGPSATTTSSDAADDHHNVASNGAAEDAPLSSPSDSRSSADLGQVTNDESCSQDGPAENNGTVTTERAGESAEDDSSSSAIIATDDAVVPDVTGKGAKRDLEEEEEESAESDKKKARA